MISLVDASATFAPVNLGHLLQGLQEINNHLDNLNLNLNQMNHYLGQRLRGCQWIWLLLADFLSGR
jgi:hypothetical protein